MSRSHKKAAGNFFASIPARRPLPSAVSALLVLCLFLLAGGATPLKAQTTVRISGYVYDAADGHPVKHALVSIRGSEITAGTDQFGRFVFENVPEGPCSLDISALGYLPATSDRIEVVSDITRQVTIRLVRSYHDMGVREVQGQAAPLPVVDLEVIDLRELDVSSARNLTDILDRIEGVYLMESGSVGGETQVSIRGSASKHVLVLLDGRRINPAASGEADLNSIPLEMVEQVEIYRGGQSARFGNDALGGAINIITRITRPHSHPELKTSNYWGKWKTDLHDLTLENPIRLKQLTTRFTYGYRYTRGDFDYNYTGAVYPRQEIERTYSGQRHNADFESRNYFVSALYRLDGSARWHFSGQRYQSHQGLPGRASQPDLTTRKSDDRIIANLNFQYDFSSRQYAEMTLGFSRLQQQFDNGAGPSPYLSRFINDIADLEVVARRQLWIGNELSGGLALQRNILYQDELLNPKQSMGRTVRDNVGFFTADRQSWHPDWLPLLDVATLDASVRWDNTDTKGNAGGGSTHVHHLSQWSHKIGASIACGKMTRLIIRGSYGTSYRLPEINALFWKSDVRAQGNPDLRPEQSEHSDAGIELSIDRGIKVTAGLTYFHSYIRDIIVWRPSSPLGIWQPENLDAALITGHEDFVRVEFFDERVRLSYSNTITNPQNKSPSSTSYNKFLTFRPHYITHIEGSLRWWKLRGSYQVRMVDIRYLLDANTRWYGAYRVDNVDCGFTTDISHFKVEAGYQIKNLRGAEYQLITHYPMPGREWGVNIAISYRLD